MKIQQIKKGLLKNLQITEDHENDKVKWFLDFKIPAFQNKKPSLEIDEETANEIMGIQSN